MIVLIVQVASPGAAALAGSSLSSQPKIVMANLTPELAAKIKEMTQNSRGTTDLSNFDVEAKLKVFMSQFCRN